MLTINVICIGKVKEKFFRDAIDEYSEAMTKCKPLFENLQFKIEEYKNGRWLGE